MNNNEAKFSTLKETAVIALGELVVSFLVVGVYFLIGKFSYKVALGVLLGSVVTLVNFLILSISVNRAIDKYIAKIGDRQLNEEEAAKFAEENAASVKFAATGSFVARTLIMLGTLIVAFVLEQFDVLATLIPLLAYRPIIFVSELIRKRRER